jgi:beta-N-acetylglucosaminidase
MLDEEELYDYLYECGVLTDQFKKFLQIYFAKKRNINVIYLFKVNPVRRQ